jgi:hypothetical protein
MLFVVLVAYIFVTYVFPGEIFPVLAPLRITYSLACIGLTLSVGWLLVKRANPLSSRQFWLLTLFAGVVTLSRIVAERYLGSVMNTFHSFGPSIAMFVLAICAVDSFRKMRIIGGVITIVSLLLVVQGAAAYHFGYNASMFVLDPVTRAEYTSASTEEIDSNGTVQDQDSSAGADEGDNDDANDEDVGSTALRIRGLGALHDPNDLALALVFAVPFWGMNWRPGRKLRNFFGVIAPVFFISYGVFLTRSRGGLLALFVVIAIALSRQFGKVAGMMLLAGMLTAGVAVNFTGGRDVASTSESTRGRMDAWSEGLQMLKEQPLLGVGYGEFLEHHTLTAHNSLVLCFAETGLIGYFFWLALVLTTFWELRELRSSPGTDDFDIQLRHWAGILQVALIGLLVAAMFLSRTFVPMLYLALGLVVALSLMARLAGRTVWYPSLPKLGGILIVSEFATIILIYVVARMRFL